MQYGFFRWFFLSKKAKSMSMTGLVWACVCGGESGIINDSNN